MDGNPHMFTAAGCTLPDNALYEILLRLPAKLLDLYQWKSRYCYNIINSPDFKADHLRRTSVELLAEYGVDFKPSFIELFHPDSNVSTALPWPTYELSVYPTIPGVCNGIVCLLGDNPRNLFVLLWNPVTGECKSVDEILIPEIGGTTRRDPTCENVCFGYDDVHNDYKLVMLGENKCWGYEMHYFAPQVYVYTPSNEEWRIVSVPRVRQAEAIRNLYLSGVCHWLMKCDRDAEGIYILSFDLGTENFYDIYFPYYFGISVELLSMGQNLAVIQYVRSQVENWSYIGIWVRVGDLVQGSWDMKYMFEINIVGWPLLLWNDRLFCKSFLVPYGLVDCDLPAETAKYHWFARGQNISLFFHQRSLVSFEPYVPPLLVDV